MIVYIEEDIKISDISKDFQELSCSREAVREHQEVIIEELKKFAVLTKIIDNNTLYAIPQKMVLDEFEVNEIYSEFFYHCDIEYGCYGGIGCDFSITIKNHK